MRRSRTTSAAPTTDKDRELPSKRGYSSRTEKRKLGVTATVLRRPVEPGPPGEPSEKRRAQLERQSQRQAIQLQVKQKPSICSASSSSQGVVRVASTSIIGEGRKVA